MRATRLANRILMATLMMIAFLIMAAPMEELTTVQFVTAKIGATAMGWSVWKLARLLDAEGRI